MEFFTVMGKVWAEYSSLFLHGLWMTLYHKQQAKGDLAGDKNL